MVVRLGRLEVVLDNAKARRKGKRRDMRVIERNSCDGRSFMFVVE